MDNIRLNKTENEKFVHSILGDSANYINFNMKEKDINNILTKEKQIQFNNEVSKHEEKLEQQKQTIEKYQQEISDNILNIEIKPLFNRVLVKPFAANPFQQMKIENGIITDIGGLNPDIYQDMNTGQWVERDQMIVVATVVEAGPECKYVQEGDTVFYMKNLPTPVPFFKQGLWTIKEENLIAVVNEGLEERFNKLKNGK